VPLAVAIPGQSFVSSIFTALLRQFQDIGLLLSIGGLSESALNKIKARFLLLESCFKGAEQITGTVCVTGIPAIYNVDVWSDDRLCGYAGLDLTVSPHSLLSSYLSSWITCSRDPDVFYRHIRRNLLWYYAQTGKFESALFLALDLFDSGFIPSLNSFRDALGSLVEVYVLNVDVSGLKGAKINDRARIGNEIGSIRESLTGRQAVPERVRGMLDALIDETANRMDRARQSHTFDEWIISLLRLWGPVWSLNTMIRPINEPFMNPLQKAAFTQMDELHADLGAFFGELSVLSEYKFPPEFTLSSFSHLGNEYQLKYGPDWLKRLTDDRLLAPDAMVQILRTQDHGHTPQPAALVVPPGWALQQELANPLFTVLERDAHVVRSTDFASELLLEACTQLGWSPASGNSRPSDQLLIQARDLLAAWESQRLSEEVGRTHNLEEVLPALTKYPWNADIRRRYAELLWSYGQFGAALDQALHAILLDSLSPENWEFIGRICPSEEAPVLVASASAVRSLIYDARDKVAKGSA
jgi:hypothetical protein